MARRAAARGEGPVAGLAAAAVAGGRGVEQEAGDAGPAVEGRRATPGPATRSAFRTGMGSERASSGGSSPWSCSTCTPETAAAARSSSRPASTKTPTVVTKGGSARTMARAAAGAMKRLEPGQKLKPRASAPSRAAVERVLQPGDAADLDPHRHAQSSRSSAPGSAARTSASPTSRLGAPAARRRRASAWVRTPLSATPRTAAREARDDPLGGGQVDLEGVEVAVVDPHQAGAERQRPLRLGLGRGPPPAPGARARRQRSWSRRELVARAAPPR